MMSNKSTKRDIEALTQLIERFGADRTRWPAPERLRFAGLLASDGEARRLLREAEAFDRLLDMAPRVSAPRQAALADRIVAKALAEPRVARGGGPALSGAPAGAAHRPPEIELGAGNVTSMGEARAARRPMRPMLERSSWPAAALLAASLVLGLFAGNTGLFPDVGLSLAGMAAGDSDIDGRTLALGPEVGSAADEDTL